MAARLAEAALDYVQNRSARILTSLQAIDAAAAAKATAGYKCTCQRYARNAAARAAGFTGVMDLVTESIRLRTACYIVIAEFSGIRNSEVMSLAVNCIIPGTSRDGSTDILWLHGTLYKTGVRPKKWLVPSIIKDAVEVLTCLTAPLRAKLRQEEPELEQRLALSIPKGKARLIKRLHTVRKQKEKLFLTKSAHSIGSVLCGDSINSDLQAFCSDLGILGEDKQPYPLHSHQFRRTYARFIARSELGDLLTLRDHFGHWSIDMTVYYADGGADEYESDTELLEMIAEEKMTRQFEIMGSYLGSDAPLANGSHWLKQWRSSVRTATNKEDLIAEYAGSITLTGTGHSWCVGTDRGTCCGGLCVFEAQMCVDCNHGLIGPEHRAVWQGIRDQQVEALTLDDMGPGGRARAQEILACADKVLRRLEGLEA
jgi:integrase